MDPQTIQLHNMGYRVNQGKTQLNDKPEKIHSDVINVNPTKSYEIIFTYSKDRNKKHHKQMFMENNSCNAHNMLEFI